ncbi:MAG: cytochrome c-type biogenesis protein [Pseudomonadota bacterium]
MMTSRALALCVGLGFGQAAWPVVETYEFSDPTLEERYQTLTEELRCPKCQNQNIAESDAPIARDLRAMLHKELEEGASDSDILDSMVARYGEFVRYRPKFGGSTLVLWLAPIALLLGGIALVWTTLRNRRDVEPATQLSDGDQQRLTELLGEGRDQAQ